MYNKLDDLDDSMRHEEVKQVLGRIDRSEDSTFDEILFNLMERYV